MPRHRPATSGYARLAQADEDDVGRLSEDSLEENHNGSPIVTRYASIQPAPRDGMRSGGAHTPTRKRPNRPRRSSTGVDLKAINARLERWAEEIASKFKIHSVKGKSEKEEQLEIHHTVFQAPDGVRPLTREMLAMYAADEGDRMTKEQFDNVVESVRVAIEIGMHPKMISQGSSGSYFARNSEGKVVGVFKPKDEEPYASRNPKWTKWIHRNLFPFFFGRACLIPNLSYVSEAAAYVLDRQLRTYLVPYTDIVWLSSKSFYYDFWERRSNWRGKKSLPAKVGSFQVFLKGFKDANIFLRENPWPDQNTDYQEDMVQKRKKRNLTNCLPGVAPSDDEDDQPSRLQSPPPTQPARFHWTPTLKQAFREELEKLVILDYIMRNTDRGLDNWMIKIDPKSDEVSIVAEPPKSNSTSNLNAPQERTESTSPQRPASNTSRPYKRYEAMETSRSSTPVTIRDEQSPTITIGAIDNSLSWPWKHPDAWRSFPFGWLFLPVSLIGQPFSKKTRDHFLPLLTSTAWWSETQMALRRVFDQDSDFKESMFARQIAVMKGQAWNVVETLKQPDHGPLELTRRARVCVWDDLVDVPVAVPMRMPSTEMRRKKKKNMELEEEEMDIGAAYVAPAATKKIPQDLLDFPNDLPNPNRFDLTREDTNGDLGNHLENSLSSPAAMIGLDSSDYASVYAKEARDNLSNHVQRPVRPSAKGKTRFSFDLAPRRDGNSNSIKFAGSMSFGPGSATGMATNGATASASGGSRQRSHSTRSGQRPNFVTYEGADDLEGDLGYAAASDMEHNQRKVIVERLETVKSKNPVFTWC